MPLPLGVAAVVVLAGCGAPVAATDRASTAVLTHAPTPSPKARPLVLPPAVNSLTLVATYDASTDLELGYVHEQGATQAVAGGYGLTRPNVQITTLIARGPHPAGRSGAKALVDGDFTTPVVLDSVDGTVMVVDTEPYFCFAVNSAGAICAWSDADTWGLVYAPGDPDKQLAALLADVFRTTAASS